MRHRFRSRKAGGLKKEKAIVTFLLPKQLIKSRTFETVSVCQCDCGSNNEATAPLARNALSLPNASLTAYTLYSPSQSLSLVLFILPACPPTVVIRTWVLMLQLLPEPAHRNSGWTDMSESSCQQRVCPGDRPTWLILILPSLNREERSR
ncbi:hypothetical protein F2P81_006539 [Scophthalmus maximus]|uniref:Uncharacterized protein n=1 Tax=Scophthalmus maximus TaxID=52904 RepID=A0A6A4TCJ8_SCOMX|nr:hypothetical protein F2P81_006539 [Scophthalmus maximus]